MIKIGTAPDSWGVWYPKDDKQIGWERYIKEVQQAGYHFSELGAYGYMPTETDILKDILSSHQIQICAGTLVGGIAFGKYREEFLQNVKLAAAFLNSLGAEYLIIMDESEVYSDITEARLDAQRWKDMTDYIKMVKAVSEDLGIRCIFHPHVGTCVESEEEIICLLNDTDMDLCFDTGHHLYAGSDPVHFMAQYLDRIPYLHIKNVNVNIKQKIDAENIHFSEGFQMGVMCELDKGVIDFTTVRDLLHRYKYNGYCIVEQDMYPAPLDKPYPIAKHNLEYLNAINFCSAF